jgi:hypothetical protein
MSDQQTCDCGHPVTFHTDHGDGTGDLRCGWNPPHSRMRCACSKPTTTGVARDETWHWHLGGSALSEDDVARIHAMTDEELRRVAVIVCRPGANVYAASSSEWPALARHLATMLIAALDRRPTP